MPSCILPSTRRIPLGKALVAGLLLTSAGARAEPPPAALPASPTPAAPVAITPAPPPYDRAPRQLRYPEYTYVPGVWATPATPSPTPRTWYGWQTLLLAGGSTSVSIVAGIAGGARDSGGVVAAAIALGGAGLVFGGPIVHWAHGHTARGFGALGLNLGATAVGSGLGIAVFCVAGACRGSAGVFGVLGGVALGGGLGLITAMIIDVSVLSYDPKAPLAPSAFTRAPAWRVLPDLQISREKTTLGVVGVF